MVWLRLLFGFKGRINRLQYWGGGVLMNVLFAAVMGTVGAPLLQAKSPESIIAALASLGLVMIPLSIASLWSSLALQVKRLHDRGRTGWISLLTFLPGIGMLATGLGSGFAGGAAPDVMGSLPFLGLALAIGAYFFIDLGCLQGTPQVNRYGPPPGGGASMAASVGDEGGRGSIDWDAAGDTVQTRLQSAEAAMATAIEERRKGQVPIAHADRRASAPSLAPAAAPSGFGRRGL